MPIDAILFDKDGTLFDFGATWNVWSRRVIDDLAGGDANLARAMADAMRFDLDSNSFLPDSPVIAGTNREAAEYIASALPDRSVEEIERHLTLSAAEAPLAPAVPLAAFLDALSAQGLRLGVMTNDTEYSARAQLGGAGVLDRFAFVAGFDSGYGAKPAPDPLLAFCDAVGVAPGRTAMVGDSTHDLIAGRAAGMATLGVLTGVAGIEELAPHADAVLPDIGHIPDWLAARR
ncbi:HAD family hydrolase [Pseudodonghicola xiamenensis]|uniref:phosphoglycolate phosphatase n=1 Tax=Pseudodonghicola xiamenensis TaxID=337702 RepID=A0A8J3MCF8_9RHOB|nr:HAD family hydrolase [Pseudodonghicola xiamenensis]GHG91384.1 phosphatase [Pseudodonghicola xiamenensis]